jgi:hypothetical protein
MKVILENYKQNQTKKNFISLKEIETRISSIIEDYEHTTNLRAALASNKKLKAEMDNTIPSMVSKYNLFTFDNTSLKEKEIAQLSRNSVSKTEVKKKSIKKRNSVFQVINKHGGERFSKPEKISKLSIITEENKDNVINKNHRKSVCAPMLSNNLTNMLNQNHENKNMTTISSHLNTLNTVNSIDSKVTPRQVVINTNYCLTSNSQRESLSNEPRKERKIFFNTKFDVPKEKKHRFTLNFIKKKASASNISKQTQEPQDNKSRNLQNEEKALANPSIKISF